MANEALPPSEGRVKRQVTAKTHRFATICPPGFEDLGLQEARDLGLHIDPEAKVGSIFEWTGRLTDMYKACLFSRIASRILVRLDSFHAGAREELFRKAQAFPWELWLNPKRSVRIDAHIEYSRISHEGQAAATLQEAIQRRMSDAGVPLVVETAFIPFESEEEDNENPENKGAAVSQRVMLRIVDNHAQISLDCCDDHLHRRGWRTMSGSAPLRENLAAALLVAAGWPGKHGCLVDGMSGSGTFAIEASVISSGLPASSSKRDFAFCHWPSFAPESFDWLRRQKSNVEGRNQNQLIFANEMDPAILDQAQANAQRAELPQAITWQQGDFFNMVPPADSGLLLLNPPYGIRLSDGAGTLYPRLWKHLNLKWHNWQVLVLGPSDTPLAILKQKLLWQRSFRHGGLRIAAWFFQI